MKNADIKKTILFINKLLQDAYGQRRYLREHPESFPDESYETFAEAMNNCDGEIDGLEIALKCILADFGLCLDSDTGEITDYDGGLR